MKKLDEKAIFFSISASMFVTGMILALWLTRASEAGLTP